MVRILAVCMMLTMACGEDKSTKPDNGSNSPPSETTFRITIENHSQSYSGVTIGRANTIFHGTEYATWPGDYSSIGSFPEGEYRFEVEIWKRTSIYQEGRFYRIGRGTIYIDHNSTLKIYNDSVIWR